VDFHSLVKSDLVVGNYPRITRSLSSS